MNLNSLPISLIIFALGQAVTTVWFFIKLYFKVESMDKKVKELELENKELKKQLKELSDTLLLVKNNTDLLILGRLKTGKTVTQE